MTKKWLNETINSEVPLTQSDSSHMTSDDYYPTSSRHFYFSVFLILSCIWDVRKPWEAGEKKIPLINVRQVLNLKIMCKGKFCVFFLLISFLIIFVVVILISATRGLTWVIMHFTPPCGQNGYYNTKVNPTQKQMFSSGTKNLNYLRLQQPGTN